MLCLARQCLSIASCDLSATHETRSSRHTRSGARVLRICLRELPRLAAVANGNGTESFQSRKGAPEGELLPVVGPPSAAVLVARRGGVR